MTADRDDLAAILAKHAGWKPSSKGLLIIECDPCGHLMGIGPEPIDPNEAHRAHVAQMVLESDWLRGVRRDDWAAGYRKGADDHYKCGGTCKVPTEPPNPYRADRVDAEDTDNTTDRT